MDSVQRKIEAFGENETLSMTERAAYDICVSAYDAADPMGGMPAMMKPGKWRPLNWNKFWEIVGELESKYKISTFFSSAIDTDNNNLFVLNQPALGRGRDLLVNPQFIAELDKYRKELIDALRTFASVTGFPVDEAHLVHSITRAVQFEVQLAMALVPEELGKNMKLQNNYYSFDAFTKTYPSVQWHSYLESFSGSPNGTYSRANVHQPQYIAFVSTVFAGNQWRQQTLVNFIALKIFQQLDEFFAYAPIPNLLKFHPKLEKRTILSESSFNRHDNGRRRCVVLMNSLIPLGTGYIYVKSIPKKERLASIKDAEMQTDLVVESFLEMVDSVGWISAEGKKKVHDKVFALQKKFGWPAEIFGDFKNVTKLDEHHKILDKFLRSKQKCWFETVLFLMEAHQDLISADFPESPTVVNAFYLPEKNSLTINYAAFNPPSYRHDFPKFYNFAGQASTIGHELSHGFDDIGIQFGPDGQLTGCTWDKCGLLDQNSSLGFAQMAQCVIHQYSRQCCPLKRGNIRCANGERTQGENIADLAGLQAAYRAYRKYIERTRAGVEEDRLPGLEQYSPNQIFWISYGQNWCEAFDEAKLAWQLRNDPHSPSECRVNQVVQDIYEFSRDFNCPNSLPMNPNERCRVWTIPSVSSSDSLPTPTKMRLSSFLLLSIVVVAALAKDDKAGDGKGKERRDRPAMIRSRRSTFGTIWSGIKLAKEATDKGCKVLRTKACTTPARKQRDTPAAMLENILPSDVGALVEKSTAELKKATETEGFHELSEAAQQRVLLDAAGKQGEIVKEKLKKAIDEAGKTVDKALDKIVSYSEVPVEAKMAMKQIFDTLTDETKTPKQKVERVKDLEEKLSPELKESLKPNTDEKAIDEAARFFSSVPQQIELGKN
ncbi:hypothetical protein GPALN_005051 [Globodera pallida]|nr:hypothetical protein GPALN_005051 [Globodera pallida]